MISLLIFSFNFDFLPRSLIQKNEYVVLVLYRLIFRFKSEGKFLLFRAFDFKIRFFYYNSLFIWAEWLYNMKTFWDIQSKFLGK